MLDYLEPYIKMAESRQTFDGQASQHGAPRAVRLSDGPGSVGIVAIPAIDALSGPHQYLKIAKCIRDKRRFIALSVPGFVQGEPLPANVLTVVQAEADAVQRCMTDIPVVLAGICTGGTLAYGLAGYLETLGTPVKAVVLLDSYPVASNSLLLQALVAPEFEKAENRRLLTETRLSATAWYARLFMDWRLDSISTPTLLVRATEPMPGITQYGNWSAVWPYSHDTVDVPGNHLSMLTEHADTTAEAMNNWICDLESGDIGSVAGIKPSEGEGGMGDAMASHP